MTTTWQTRASAHLAARDALIPPAWRLPASLLPASTPSDPTSILTIPQTCGILTARELALTESHDATALLAMLAKGEVSSVELTTAFCKRAAVAGQLTNCLTEVMFEGALARAKELDKHLAETGKTMGPLHGLPISVKDSFQIKGLHATIGFVSFIGHGPATENSPLIDMLLEMGAVLYVKTNVPQTLMTAESHNHIFGRTLNPANLALTAGGSSGGEGALLALHGSPLGIGTDIGGSIRIPALLNGLYGFKPTASRLPYAGQAAPGRAGALNVLACAGPLAHSARDLEMLCGLLCGERAWARDASALSVPWRHVPRKETLTIGLLLEDPARAAHPPVLRALRSAADKLAAAGHTLFNMDPTVPLPMAFAHIAASGEPPIPSIGNTRLAPGAYLPPTLDNLYRLNEQRGAFREGWRRAFVETGGGLDVVIMPGYQAAGAKHDTYGPGTYTRLAPLLDYPAAIIPFGRADRALDAAFVREGVVYKPEYEPDAVEGIPTGIQVLAPTLRDEELLSAVATIAGVLNG